MSTQEFSPDIYDFEKYRKKGATYWIIAHVLHGYNKLIFALVIITIIISSNLSAGVLIIVGYTINDLMSGNLTIITSYILLIFLMSIG
ncbi:MAG: hypothetical protein ACTSVE_14855, partial [Candidatus Helarchaeota archaeon]